jgi:transcriptional regulator with XRE-family HTH domain
MEQIVKAMVEAQGNMTQAEFAERIGVSRSTVSMIYNGQRQPGLEMVIGLLREFPQVRCSLISFLSGNVTNVTNSVTLRPDIYAVLFQFGKENGLSSPDEAADAIIHDWQRLKATLELRRPATNGEGQPHAPAIRMPATVAQPEEV